MSEKQTPSPRTIPVVITDFDMPFESMVLLMVKWALASIPAILILVVLGFLAGLLIGGLGAIFKASYSTPASYVPTATTTHVPISPERFGIQYPAPDDPRASEYGRACIKGEVYTIENAKWVPSLIDGAPTPCIVMK